MINSSLSKSHN